MVYTIVAGAFVLGLLCGSMITYAITKELIKLDKLFDATDRVD